MISHIRIEHGYGGIDVGRVRISSVEPCPPQPQKPRARQHKQDIVRGEALPVPSQSWPNPVGCCEASHAGGEMDNIATRVVDHAPLKLESAAPEAESANRVGKCEPQRHKQHPCPEVHSAEK